MQDIYIYKVHILIFIIYYIVYKIMNKVLFWIMSQFEDCLGFTVTTSTYLLKKCCYKIEIKSTVN